MGKVIFILTLLISSFSRAEIWSGHVKPTLQKGFDSRGLLIAGVGTASFIGAQQNADDEVRDTWGSNQRLSHDQTRPGDFFGTGIPGISIAIAQLFFDSENGYAHSEALAWSFVVTSILKQGNQRMRPNGLNRHSMPSGHTSTSFTTATSLAYAYGWKVAIPAYLVATYVAVTRVSDDAHWLSDTMAGATIGIFWGRATSFHHQSENTAVIEPWIFESGGYGLRWAKTF